MTAARPEDVDRICAELPETWFGTSWGDVPTWLVPARATERGKGRGFVRYRRPRPDEGAVDPVSGEPYTDLLVIATPDRGAKAALVQGPGPWFDIPHFRHHDAVLVRLSRLGEVTRAELAEVLADAWRTAATPRLRREHPDV